MLRDQLITASVLVLIVVVATALAVLIRFLS
jgi:hypothetical protein